MGLSQSVILITGGSSGIGQATCELFSEQGATILFTSRSKDKLSQLEQQYKDKGAKDAKGYILDIRKKEDSVNLVKQIKEDYGKIDVLVNNAGIGIYKSVHELDFEEWDNVISTNLTGVFYLTHEVLPLMIAQNKGYIVNVVSLAGVNTFAKGAAYCASKHGLMGFSDSLMVEVRQYNIKVSVIMPGSVNTHFNNNVPQNDEETWKLIPKDVADAIYSVVSARWNHLMSRVEIRTLTPSK